MQVDSVHVGAGIRQLDVFPETHGLDGADRAGDLMDVNVDPRRILQMHDDQIGQQSALAIDQKRLDGSPRFKRSHLLRQQAIQQIQPVGPLHPHDTTVDRIQPTRTASHRRVLQFNASKRRQQMRALNARSVGPPWNPLRLKRGHLARCRAGPIDIGNAVPHGPLRSLVNDQRVQG
jgi:hypothetical protein